MVFTIEKFIEILKDPMCVSFEWEVEGCKIAFYREWVAYYEDKKSYNSVIEWICHNTEFCRNLMKITGYYPDWKSIMQKSDWEITIIK